MGEAEDGEEEAAAGQEGERRQRPRGGAGGGGDGACDGAPGRAQRRTMHGGLPRLVRGRRRQPPLGTQGTSDSRHAGLSPRLFALPRHLLQPQWHALCAM